MDTSFFKSENHSENNVKSESIQLDDVQGACADGLGLKDAIEATIKV